MSALTLRLKDRSSQRIRLHGIVPNAIGPLSLFEISRMAIEVDGQSSELGQWFDIQEGHREAIVLEGALENCDAIGGGMLSGQMTVQSSVGDHLAQRMRGGSLTVHGSAGSYACGELRGGQVVIYGNCGPYTASAMAGQQRGMAGGICVIHGDVGPWLATRMRRGLVVVMGDVAAGCANRMIAGTLVVCGHIQQPVGSGMARGTIVVHGPSSNCSIPSGFTAPEHTELSYFRILMSEVSEFLPEEKHMVHCPTTVWRSLGDRVQKGLGEIIWTSDVRVDDTDVIAHA